MVLNGSLKICLAFAFATSFCLKKASGKMPRTSHNQRFGAVGILESGTSVSVIAKFGMSRQTVRLWLHRCQTTGTVSTGQHDR